MIRLAFCRDCGAAHYPLREVCARCLSDRVEVRQAEAAGTLIASTLIHRSIEPRFASRLPLRIGSVKLDAGPVVVAFIPGDDPLQPGTRLQLEARNDDGRELLHAAARR